jgi:hypothetical protein
MRMVLVMLIWPWSAGGMVSGMRYVSSMCVSTLVSSQKVQMHNLCKRIQSYAKVWTIHFFVRYLLWEFCIDLCKNLAKTVRLKWQTASTGHRTFDIYRHCGDCGLFRIVGSILIFVSRGYLKFLLRAYALPVTTHSPRVSAHLTDPNES